MTDKVIKLIEQGKLSSGHARALINVDKPEEIAQIILSKNLNVRQTEALVKKLLKKDHNYKAVKNDPNIKSLEVKLSETTGLVVKINDSKGKGSITLKYSNLEQLDNLIGKLS